MKTTLGLETIGVPGGCTSLKYFGYHTLLVRRNCNDLWSLSSAALICFRETSVVGRAHLEVFGPPGEVLEEKVVAWLRKLSVIPLSQDMGMTDDDEVRNTYDRRVRGERIALLSHLCVSLSPGS